MHKLWIAAAAAMLAIGVLVAMLVLVAEPVSPAPAVATPATPQPAAEPLPVELPAEAPPAEAPPADAGLAESLARLEARVAALEQAQRERPQATGLPSIFPFTKMTPQMKEDQLNKNLEKAAKDLAALRAERHSRGERGKLWVHGYLKRKYGYTDEQAQKIEGPVTDYLDRRAQRMAALIEAYLNTGGKGDLSAERDALNALDGELMPSLDATFDPDVATTVLEKLKFLVMEPFYLRQTDPTRTMEVRISR